MQMLAASHINESVTMCLITTLQHQHLWLLPILKPSEYSLMLHFKLYSKSGLMWHCDLALKAELAAWSLHGQVPKHSVLIKC